MLFWLHPKSLAIARGSIFSLVNVYFHWRRAKNARHFGTPKIPDFLGSPGGTTPLSPKFVIVKKLDLWDATLHFLDEAYVTFINSERSLNSMTKSEWVIPLFHAIDAKDILKFTSFLSEDCAFRFGNNPIVSGKENISVIIAAFFDSIEALRHTITEQYHDKDSLICRGEVTYTRKDMKKVTVPFCNVFKTHDGKITQYLIYVDVMPLYA